MTKRGRDLFELLELRQRGGQPRKRPSSSRGSDFADRARQWVDGAAATFDRLRSRKAKPSQRKKKADKPQRQRKQRPSKESQPAMVSIPGLWLAAMLLVALGSGFLVGRGTASAASIEGQEELRAGVPRTELKEPSLLEDRTSRVGSSDLGLQKDVETLSPFFYVVLNYPESEGNKATQLAEYLRTHGLDTARIRTFPSSTSGLPLWVVVVYVADREDQDGYRERLLSVPPPQFERRLAPRLRQRLTLRTLEPLEQGE